MTDMGSVVLLLFLVKAALTAPSVYVVTGAGSYNGVYEEKREDQAKKVIRTIQI